VNYGAECGDRSNLIAADADDLVFARLRAAETTGRPVGAADVVADLDRRRDGPSAAAHQAVSRPG
jgi:hypothetical protein